MSRLANKIAIVTGSSSGLGRAIAQTLASEGASVICSDIQETPVLSGIETSALPTHGQIQKDGGKAIYVKCDTSISEDVQNLVNTAVKEYGRLDIIVNNAGIALESAHPQPIWSYPESAFDRTIAVNLRGVFLGTKYASNQMRQQEPHANGDRGWIINIASVLGLGGSPMVAGYSSSKHGVMGLTKVAAWDCAPHRIHVNAICPGYVNTAMIQSVLNSPETGSAQQARLQATHPFRGLGEPQDIARAALFLASEECSWITGVGLPVDGGYSSM